MLDKRFWAIYKEAFPPEQRRSEAQQLEIMKCKEYKLKFHIVMDELQAFLAFWQFENFVFLEHFAVDKKWRGKGIGRIILEELCMNHEQPIFLEVERPENEHKIKRIRFYEQLGFVLNDFAYEQPAYTEEGSSIDLAIMSLSQKISKESFAKYKRKIYEKVYHKTIREE